MIRDSDIYGTNIRRFVHSFALPSNNEQYSNHIRISTLKVGIPTREKLFKTAAFSAALMEFPVFCISSPISGLETTNACPTCRVDVFGPNPKFLFWNPSESYAADEAMLQAPLRPLHALLGHRSALLASCIVQAKQSCVPSGPKKDPSQCRWPQVDFGVIHLACSSCTVDAASSATHQASFRLLGDDDAR